ncbi:MAG: hypothetical protein LWW93_10870 [Hyphomicrobiales bacterium]|nr:hypothetical protein [Hyphomicrobiales bacterium]
MSDDETLPRDETTGEGAEVETMPPPKRRRPPQPVYDQAFFLDLARPHADTDEARAEARERWNAWRRKPENAGVRVTFEGVDFRTEENRGISFSGFEFGHYSNFRLAIFSDKIDFSGSIFGNEASFSGAIFDNFVFFGKVEFGDLASFSYSRFGLWAEFSRSSFLKRVSFEGASFCGRINFQEAQFFGLADFTGRSGESDIGASLKAWQSSNSYSSGEINVKIENYKKIRDIEGFGPSRFSDICLAGVRFFSGAAFTKRSFERIADFSNAQFDFPPDFSESENLQRIDFTGARVGFASADRPWWKPEWTTDSSVALRLRALRSQIEATKNHDFERDLYIEERKAERGIYFDRFLREKRWGALAGHSLWIAVMALYWALSDYGRSWLRPAAWLAVSIPAFDLVYAHLLADRRESAVATARETVTKSLAGQDALAVVRGWQTAEAHVRADYDAVVGQLAVSNAVPFVGPLTIDADAKKFLFCGVWPTKGETATGTLVEPCRPIPPPGFQLATISQNLLSIVLVFFIGLALRNYFRVK